MWLIPQSLACALVSECSKRAFPPDCEPSDTDLAFWAMSSGTPTLRPSSWHGWKARRWSQHLFGRATYRMFDGSNLLAQWILSAQGFRASRTAWPVAGKAPMTSDGSGLPSRTAFAECSLGSSIWRMYPASDLLGDSPLYSQTWPRSGSVSNGIASERPTWVPAISGSGCSSWPTTDVCSASRDMSKIDPEQQKTASGKVTIGLPTIAEAWPTPASRDQKGENSIAHMTNGGGRIMHIDQLPNFVMYHFSRQDQTMNDGQKSLQQDQTSPPQRLNANFVDWLMGWPTGWTSTETTACDAAAMASWRCKLDWHLSYLLGEPELRKDAA